LGCSMLVVLITISIGNRRSQDEGSQHDNACQGRWCALLVVLPVAVPFMPEESKSVHFLW